MLGENRNRGGRKLLWLLNIAEMLLVHQRPTGKETQMTFGRVAKITLSLLQVVYFIAWFDYPYMCTYVRGSSYSGSSPWYRKGKNSVSNTILDL